MRITDLLKEEGIRIGGSPQNKAEAIDQMVKLMVNEGNIKDPEKYREAVLLREEESTTAVGDGIAIPHAKTDAVTAPGLAAMTVPDGVDYEAPDGEPSDLIFLIAAPNTEDNVHLQVLSRLSTLLMDDDFTDALRAAKSAEEFRSIIDRAEKDKLAEEKAAEEAAKNNDQGYQILAVTACPTGIAHTYMAAEAIEKTAKQLGYTVKVETNGSGGAKNVLTPAEIAACEGIIIAADKKIETARFNGKPVLSTSVSAGINKPEELVNKVMHHEVPVFQADSKEAAAQASAGEKEGVGRTFYKNLMNGVSHMLPFVVGGGILTAIAFLVDNYAINPANFGMNTPAAAFFKTIGGAAFGVILPILAAYIASSIADRPGLAVGFVAGLLANGGYTFGTLMNYDAGTTVSGGFLGAMLAGFIAGYVVVFLKKVFSKLPDALEGIKPMLLYPLLGILITGFIIILINPIMVGINTGIMNFLEGLGSGSRVLLGFVVAGMMSIDMGGPINKASYAFGLASLAAGNEIGFQIMAAVMIGGMVAPLATALSTTFFKKRWTEDERKAGVVNYILGLSFISEGAIPFAAADPLRVLPACIIGSGISGALSMIFKCGSRAPHGGFWVIGVIDNPIGYIIALLIGSVVAALILTLLKKRISE